MTFQLIEETLGDQPGDHALLKARRGATWEIYPGVWQGNEVGLPVQRVSYIPDYPILEVHFREHKPYESENAGLTNGYHRYRCSSPDGKYAVAFSSDSQRSVMIDLETFTGRMVTFPSVDGRTFHVGTNDQPRWNPHKPHELWAIDQFGARVIAIDASSLEMTVVRNFNDQSDGYWQLPWGPERNWIGGEPHASVSEYGFPLRLNDTGKRSDGRYLDKISVVLKWDGDLQEFSFSVAPDLGGHYVRMQEQLAATKLRQTFIDFPSGKLLHQQEGSLHGHEVWVQDADGRWVWMTVPKSYEYLCVFDPADWERPKALCHHRAFGYHNFHPAAVRPGWALISTYGNKVDPLNNQLFLIEVPGAANRGEGKSVRIIRLGGHNTRWYIEGASKDAMYYGEAFASCDGRYVWWGCNFGGTRWTELVRMDLQPVWDKLGLTTPSADEPEPEPTPDPPVEPEPAEPEKVYMKPTRITPMLKLDYEDGTSETVILGTKRGG